MWGGLYDLNYYFKVLEYSDLTVLNLAWIPYQLIIHISKRRISQLVPFHNLGTVLSFWSKDLWMFLNIILEYVSSVLTHLCNVSILFLIKHRNCWFGDKNRIWWSLNFFPENILSLPPDVKSDTWVPLIWGKGQTAAICPFKKTNLGWRRSLYLHVRPEYRAYKPGGPVMKWFQPHDCLSYPDPSTRMDKVYFKM